MHKNYPVFTTPPKHNIVFLWQKLRKEKILFILKLIIVVGLPTFILIEMQISTWWLSNLICQGEINVGYGPLNPYIPAIDGPLNYDWEHQPYPGGIPYIEQFNDIYHHFTNLMWVLAPCIIFIFYGQKSFYRYIELCFIYFVVFVVLCILFPTVCEFKPWRTIYDYCEWPSGHCSVAYLPFLFMRQKSCKKYWYHHLITSIYLVSAILIILSTLFIKAHYFMDPVLTIIFMELTALFVYLMRSRYRINFVCFILYNLNQFIYLQNKNENPYHQYRNKICALQKKKYLILITYISIGILVGLIITEVLYLNKLMDYIQV